MLHDDGTPAQGPIALAETQGYVYYAKRRLAAVYGQLGDVERAERLSQSAARLKRAFNERFWMEDEGFYAMALDGQKRQVRQVSSTIGHALWSRIVAEERIPDVVRRLMAPDMFTGWGIRTLSKDARFYNPVSFYNGSVWPFDTALIANGLKKHGYVQEANRLAWGLVEAATAHEYARLPEMFCGLTRQSVDRPVSFPMACSPGRQLGRRPVPRAPVDARHLRPGGGEHRLRPQPRAATLAGRGDGQQPARRPHHHAPALPP